jgi:putative spermidine/putrescine transport system ATP-binding protein
MENYVDIRGLTKFYGQVRALAGVDLTMARGEFLSVLGPSGSGKTTVMMAIAGFLPGATGHISIDGQDLSRLPANRRNIGVVFQNYALFPRMSVLSNVMYPLRTRRVPKAEARRRALDYLGLVGLADFANRGVEELSGGQRQRVALARAVVYEPPVLLMDEPLSALDKNLREQMQIEIRRLHEKLGLTTLYVTHDQREAMSMSDRICVMADGQIQQTGSPLDIYRAPASDFVASFFGETSFIRLPGFDRNIAVRSEDFLLEPDPSAACIPLEVEAQAVAFQGESWLVTATAADGVLVQARVPARHRAAHLFEGRHPPERLTLYLRRSDLLSVGKGLK